MSPWEVLSDEARHVGYRALESTVTRMPWTDVGPAVAGRARSWARQVRAADKVKPLRSGVLGWLRLAGGFSRFRHRRWPTTRELIFVRVEPDSDESRVNDLPIRERSLPRLRESPLPYPRQKAWPA